MCKRPEMGAQGKEKNIWVKAGEYSALGFILPSCIFVGWALGYLIDERLHTGWMQMAGIILGSVAGFVALFRKANQLFKQE